MKKMKRIDSINVIPFIDIMLVLLVMVLTTATFIKTGLIPVDLPEAKGSAAEHKPSELKLTIKKDGTLWIDEKTSVTLEQFEQKVTEGGKEMTVVLYSDKEAAFQNFVGVMDVLKRLGHEQLYIVTDKK
ncbi:MAG: biopolymer transporter ExbD [Sulfuricurvum sp. MLSB]|jgi:biopolymer transport protein ExbD|uniref:ExbD/TolR family protein n=1 Tax=unclassified Sulfuricurvum TaxID=2632390 RepID=UPI0005054278|nr:MULTISPECIES: biopolymer transporter ExbD [unclassified Sulfuricurvum]KFN39120.1 MAG: biopolymer transporter ExbD [Sulfuricurvum sp. MLSB]